MPVTEERQDLRKWYRDSLGRCYRAFASNDPEVHPPTEQFVYRVGRAECRHGQISDGVKIEGQLYKIGEVLGRGFCQPGYPVELCHFKPADGAEKVAIGHIMARLRDGRIVAEPVEE